MKRTNYIIAIALGMLLILSINASAQIISTYAGTGTEGYSGDGGPAINAEMNQPVSLARDAAGNIYIGEGNGNVIRKVDPSGIITTFAGTGVAGYSGDGGPATAAQFSGPDGLTFDSNGNLYVADFGNNVIRKINTAGIVTTIAGTGIAGYSGDGGPASAAQFHFPRDMRFDAAGNMYICDWLNYVIRKIDVAGIITTIAGTGIAGYTGDGGPATVALIGLPYRSCFDAAGNLFFVDGTNNCIRKIDLAGIITTVVGNGTAGFSGDGGPAIDALLSMPTALTFDIAGKMYIADRGNDRIRNINALGIINTVCGNGTAGETGDGGPAIDAEINKPFDLMFDAENYFYIADINGNKVRKMTPDPSLGVVQNARTDNSFIVLPNPNNGVFYINGSLNSCADENITISVSDILGQVVLRTMSKAVDGKIDLKVNIDENVRDGVYLLTLKSLSKTYSSRFILKK